MINTGRNLFQVMMISIAVIIYLLIFQDLFVNMNFVSIGVVAILITDKFKRKLMAKYSKYNTHTMLLIIFNR